MGHVYYYMRLLYRISAHFITGYHRRLSSPSQKATTATPATAPTSVASWELKQKLKNTPLLNFTNIFVLFLFWQLNGVLLPKFPLPIQISIWNHFQVWMGPITSQWYLPLCSKWKIMCQPRFRFYCSIAAMMLKLPNIRAIFVNNC